MKMIPRLDSPSRRLRRGLFGSDLDARVARAFRREIDSFSYTHRLPFLGCFHDQ